jgi:hypothetical protein
LTAGSLPSPGSFSSVIRPRPSYENSFVPAIAGVFDDFTLPNESNDVVIVMSDAPLVVTFVGRLNASWLSTCVYSLALSFSRERTDVA